MEGKIVFRHAEPNDIGAILAVQQSSPEAAAWEARDYVCILADEATLCLAAEDSITGRVAGFLLARIVADDLEVFNLAVRPEYRRRGIGRRLLADALELARAQGACRCWLEVRATNDVGRYFYQALGFAENGRRPRYYCDPDDDAVVCVRRLTRPESSP